LVVGGCLDGVTEDESDVPEAVQRIRNEAVGRGSLCELELALKKLAGTSRIAEPQFEISEVSRSAREPDGVPELFVKRDALGQCSARSREIAEQRMSVADPPQRRCDPRLVTVSAVERERLDTELHRPRAIEIERRKRRGRHQATRADSIGHSP